MSDSSSSTPRSPKRKSRRKKGRGGDGSSGGSDASDGASSSSDRSGVSSGDESGGDAGPSPAELRARAAARAASLSRDLAAKYNKLRHTVEHLKHHLAERRVQLPVVHLLPEQTADGLLTAAKSRAAPKDSPAWVAWLIAWESEHFRPAEARCHLLLQLKADLRCLSRVLLSAKVSPSERKQRAAEKEEEEGGAITRGEGKALGGGERDRGERGEIRWTGAPLRKPQYHPSKEWREAMLHGQSYEDLIKAKAERLAKARFRRERRKAREAVANAEWETAAEKVASGIQRMWRAKIAQRRIQDMLDQVYEKVYDEAAGGYYYYNKVTCTTSWEKPKLLRHEMEGVY